MLLAPACCQLPCLWLHHSSLCLHLMCVCVCAYVRVLLSFIRTLITGFRAGFPGGAGGKELACQCRRPKRRRFNPWVRKILWRRKWQFTPVFLPGKSHGQRSP